MGSGAFAFLSPVTGWVCGGCSCDERPSRPALSGGALECAHRVGPCCPNSCPFGHFDRPGSTDSGSSTMSPVAVDPVVRQPVIL